MKYVQGDPEVWTPMGHERQGPFQNKPKTPNPGRMFRVIFAVNLVSAGIFCSEVLIEVLQGLPCSLPLHQTHYSACAKCHTRRRAVCYWVLNFQRFVEVPETKSN